MLARHRPEPGREPMPASRLVFAVALLLCCLGALAAGHAQQPPKVFRIGFLGSGSRADTDPRLEAFRQRLRDLGYIEGRTIVIEHRWAEGKMERLPALAAELAAKTPPRPSPSCSPRAATPKALWWPASPAPAETSPDSRSSDPSSWRGSSSSSKKPYRRRRASPSCQIRTIPTARS